MAALSEEIDPAEIELKCLDCKKAMNFGLALIDYYQYLGNGVTINGSILCSNCGSTLKLKATVILEKK